jgi:hypothetical protein
VVEHPDHLLGAADGKGGHQQDAGVVAHLVDRGDQLVDRLVVRGVLAVPVGRLDHDVVGLADRRRVAKDRRVVAAEVAGEDDRAGFGAIGDAEFDDGRPQDVAGVVEDGRHAIGHGDLVAIVAAAHLAHGGVDVLLVVERLSGLGAALGRRVAQPLGE